MTTLKNDLGTITEIAKKVILKMGQKEVPLVPENYHVWFDYFTGANQELTTDIENVIAAGKAFDSSLNEELYNKYCGSEKEKELMLQVQKETQNILKNIFDEVLSTNSITSEYVEKLEAYSQQLNNADELSHVQHVLKEIISDTDKMAESSRIFRDRLEEADKQAQALRHRLEKTERETLIDPLTELHNRKSLQEKLKELFDDFSQNGNAFTGIMLDIDFFKKINDTYGHKIGDDVLKIVASTLFETVKGMDFPARYGGEEFVVLLPATLLDNACTVAEHLRKNISQKKLKLVKTGEKIGNITVSAGVAEIQTGDTIEDFLVRADKALYLAKNSGRNNVKSEKDLT